MQDRSPDSRRAGDTIATTGDRPAVPDGAGGAGLPAAGSGGPAARYRLGEEIARGGMGVVCRATDTVLGREVAVKVLQGKYAADSGTALRFVAEARITGQLQHPGIPAIHDLGILPDGRPFLAMKLIKGETLDQLLRRRGAAAGGRGGVVAVLEQLCQAVAYAHAHGVVHRDLKPANIMVGAFGEVQVMDWGLAKVLAPGHAAADEAAGDPRVTTASTEVRPLLGGDLLTHSGSVLGTPAYMPPEQAIGAVDQVDARSDVFGLGGVLAAVLTGHPPFVGDSAENSRQLAARGKVHDCFSRLDRSGADPELVALCKRCLSPEKADRPAHAGEVAAAVAALRAAADERARRAELDRARVEGEKAAAEARSAEHRKRRRLIVVAGAMLAAAVFGGLSVILVVQRRANAELALEKAKVEKRFELAHKAIGTLHTGVSEDLLLKSAQFKELRVQLLRQAADFYSDLERLLQGEADPKSRRALAGGYSHLAELNGNIGSPAEALAVHRKALAVRRELAAAAGADVETRLDVARSLDAMGRLLLTTGETADALGCFNEQQEVAAALEAECPTEDTGSVLARSLRGRGRALRRLERSEEALIASEKAVSILRKLVDTNPANAGLQFDLASSQISLGNILGDTDRWVERLAAEENARGILQNLVDAHSEVTQYRDRLAIAHNNIGYSLFDVGKTGGALAAHQRSLAVAQKLWETHPAVIEFQILLAFSYCNVGLVLSETAQPSEAMAAYEKAREFARKSVDANPADIQLQFRLAFACIGIGEMYSHTGRPNEALKSHEEAQTILTKIAAADPGCQSVLASSLNDMGIILSASGKSEQALETCSKALAILQKLSNAQRTNARAREELAECLAVLGSVQRSAGRHDDAVASIGRAITLLERSRNFTPRNYLNVARYHALLARSAPGAGATANSEEAVAAERAMLALRQAIMGGYDGVTRLRTDTFLDALRPRADFQKLVAEVEAKAAVNRVSPDKLPQPDKK